MLYHHHPDLSSVLLRYDSFLNKLKAQIKIIIYKSSTDIIQTIQSWKPHDYQFALDSICENVWRLEITRNIYGRKKRVIQGLALLIKHDRPNIYVVITHEKSDYVKNGLQTFFNKYYPDIAKTYLTSNNQERILENLERKTNGKIFSTRLIAYKKNKRKNARRSIESIVKYIDESFIDSFKKARENDEWVNKIDFQLLCPEIISKPSSHTESIKQKVIFNGYLSHPGILKCNKNFSAFYKNIVEDVAAIGAENKIFFDKRARIKEEDYKSKPVIIEYDYPIFSDKEQNARLINALFELPKSSCSVFHANPYVHTSIVDYIDGSAYDIWVLSSNRISVVPQMKSTFASFERLCDHIFRKFKEGALKNFEVSDYDR